MSTWRCPNCGTPQAEAARCWVCHRSSTTCSTCRHFRASLAASVGYCCLDRRRTPLRGTEHRGCWEPAHVAAATTVSAEASPSEVQASARPNDPAVARLRPGTHPRPGVLEGFVPIELANRGPRALRPADRAPLQPPPAVEVVESWTDRETLFGDA